MKRKLYRATIIKNGVTDFDKVEAYNAKQAVYFFHRLYGFKTDVRDVKEVVEDEVELSRDADNLG